MRFRTDEKFLTYSKNTTYKNNRYYKSPTSIYNILIIKLQRYKIIILTQAYLLIWNPGHFRHLEAEAISNSLSEVWKNLLSVFF